MSVDPRLLRGFVAVAEELHFGRAARRLHMTQPPLSVQIHRLEDQVGTRLFVRSRRGVALTEAGGFLLGHARHLLGETERVCAEAGRIGRGEAGVLALAYTPTATYELLPALGPAFRRLRPDVRLDMTEMRSGLQPDAIRAGRAEVGFACGPIAAPDLAQEVLARERAVVALPARHPLARRAHVPVRALAGEPYVQVRPDIEPVWADACTAAIAAAGVMLAVSQQTDTKIAMLGLVAAGEGISVVSSSMMRLGRDGVVFRELRGVAVRLVLVSLAAPRPSPRADVLLRLARRVASSSA